MKKILLSLIVSCLTVQAGLVTINYAPNHSPNGGEFILTPDTGLPFHTFCLERNEYITIGHTYQYQVSDRTDGGVNGPDPISVGTAWLYRQFIDGNLANAHYVAGPSQQTDLQNTFWYLEGEISTLSNPFWLNLAQTQLGASVNLFADANGAYGVGVWNLFDANGSHAQSQLGVVPEPSTFLAGACLLLPFAASTVRIVSNRKHRFHHI